MTDLAMIWPIWQGYDRFGRDITDLAMIWPIWQGYNRFGNGMTDLAGIWPIWQGYDRFGRDMTDLARIWPVWQGYDRFGKDMTGLAGIWPIWQGYDWFGQVPHQGQSDMNQHLIFQWNWLRSSQYFHSYTSHSYRLHHTDVITASFLILALSLTVFSILVRNLEWTEEYYTGVVKKRPAHNGTHWCFSFKELKYSWQA